MTKYILHGGSAQHPNDQNDEFFNEILKGTSDHVKILLVHFASSLEKMEQNIERDTTQFDRVKGTKKLSFEEANEESFINQIAKNDVVYFGGGTTVKLLDTLKQYSNLKESFEGKIIAGESAGANSLASYCYSKSGGGVMKGLGLVPVKIIPHFEGEHKEDLEDITERLEILLLKDYEYKVFEI